MNCPPVGLCYPYFPISYFLNINFNLLSHCFEIKTLRMKLKTNQIKRKAKKKERKENMKNKIKSADPLMLSPSFLLLPSQPTISIYKAKIIVSPLYQQRYPRS